MSAARTTPKFRLFQRALSLALLLGLLAMMVTSVRSRTSYASIANWQIALEHASIHLSTPTDPKAKETLRATPGHRFDRIEPGSTWWYASEDSGSHITRRIPLWFALLPVAIWTHWSWRSAPTSAALTPPTHCGACGYDLRPSTGHASCPECGLDAAGQVRSCLRRRARRRNAVVVITLLIGGPAFFWWANPDGWLQLIPSSALRALYPHTSLSYQRMFLTVWRGREFDAAEATAMMAVVGEQCLADPGHDMLDAYVLLTRDIAIQNDGSLAFKKSINRLPPSLCTVVSRDLAALCASNAEPSDRLDAATAYHYRGFARSIFEPHVDTIIADNWGMLVLTDAQATRSAVVCRKLLSVLLNGDEETAIRANLVLYDGPISPEFTLHDLQVGFDSCADDSRREYLTNLALRWFESRLTTTRLPPAPATPETTK